MTDATNAERQARFTERARGRGLAKVCEWVPEECRDELKAVASAMREAAGLASPDAALRHAAPEHQARVAERRAAQRAQARNFRSFGWSPTAIAHYLGLGVDDVADMLEGE